MNAVLYKLYVADKDDTKEDMFNAVQVLNEYELRQFFRRQVDEGYIHPDNLAAHDITIQDTEKVWNIDLDAIFGTLADNITFAEKDEKYECYYIEQFDIALGDEDLYD